MYANMHDGKLPDRLQTLADEGMVPPDLFRCPATGRGAVSPDRTDAESDYVYVGAGRDVFQAQNPSEIPLVYDKPGNHPDGSVCVVYMDGHVARQDSPPE
jgi:hypothetical protein